MIGSPYLENSRFHQLFLPFFVQAHSHEVFQTALLDQRSALPNYEAALRAMFDSLDRKLMEVATGKPVGPPFYQAHC